MPRYIPEKLSEISLEEYNIKWPNSVNKFGSAVFNQESLDLIEDQGLEIDREEKKLSFQLSKSTVYSVKESFGKKYVELECSPEFMGCISNLETELCEMYNDGSDMMQKSCIFNNRLKLKLDPQVVYFNNDYGLMPDFELKEGCKIRGIVRCSCLWAMPEKNMYGVSLSLVQCVVKE